MLFHTPSEHYEVVDARFIYADNLPPKIRKGGKVKRETAIVVGFTICSLTPLVTTLGS